MSCELVLRAERDQIPERKPGEPCPLCTHESKEWNKRLTELIALGLGEIPQERITAAMLENARLKSLPEPCQPPPKGKPGLKPGMSTKALRLARIEQHAVEMRLRAGA